MLQLHPDTIGGYIGMGNVFFQRGKYMEAEQFFEKARQLMSERKDEYSETYNNQNRREAPLVGVSRMIGICREK
jgi:hypothetical protein